MSSTLDPATRPSPDANALTHVRSLLDRWSQLSRREAQQIVDAIRATGLQPHQVGVAGDVLRAVHRFADGDRNALRNLAKQRGNLPAHANAAEPLGLTTR
jgi:hypothetical protein